MEMSSQWLNLLWSVSTALRLQPTDGEGSALCGLPSGFLGRKILLQEENLYKLYRVDPWFSAGGDFASTPGDVRQCLKAFLVVTTRGRVLLVWVRGATKHPTIHRSTPAHPGATKDYLAQNVNKAKIESLW